MKKTVHLLLFSLIVLITGCASQEVNEQPQVTTPSKKTTKLSCHRQPPSFPSMGEMSDMSIALKHCESKAPDARAVYDPGWSCYIWSINGSDADKMKRCLLENYGWKELGPPRWINNTMAAPPF